MAELDRDQLEALAKGIAQSGVATETTLRALVKALGGDTGMKAVAQATGKTAKEMKTMGSYLNDLNDELEDTTQGLTKYQKVNNALSIGITVVTGNLSHLGGSIRMVGDQFGVLGGIVGDTLGYLVDRLSENVDFYRSISQIGGAAGQSISNLRAVAGQTGLTMDQLSDAVVQAGSNLTLLGGTTGAGLKKFTDALTDLSKGETFNNLTALGFTMREISMGAAEYLELQTQLGRTQTMDSRQLSSETSEYLMNLDLLTRLTGKNRQELQKEMQARAKDSRLSLQLAGMTQAQQREVNSAIEMTGVKSKGLADSLQNLIATDGVATNAREAGIMAIDGMREAIHGLARGEAGSAQQLMQVFSKLANETGDLTAEERQRYAQLKQLGVDFNDVRFETIGFKNGLGDLEKATKEQKAAQEAAGSSALGFDKATQRLSTAFQGLLSPITDLLGGAVGLLANVLEKMASMVLTVQEKLGTFGGAVVSLGALITTIAVGKVAGAGIGAVASKGASYLPGMGGGKGGAGGGMVGKLGAGVGGVFKGIGAGVKGLGSGLATLGGPMGVKALAGAAVLAGIITILGAGVGAAAFLAGKGLNTFAEALEKFQTVDGDKLGQIAKAATSLSVAMVKLGGGSLKGGVTGFFGKLFGGGPENFAKNINKTLDELDKNKIDMYANSLDNLGNAMSKLQSGMNGSITSSASATGDKLERLNNTMEQILHVLDEGNKYSRITSKATTDTAENFG